MAKMMLIIVNLINFSCCAVVILLSIRLVHRSIELRKATQQLQKLERLYRAMAMEMQNMVDAMMLCDPPGVQVFYDKLNKLHGQFMAVGKDDHEHTNSHHSDNVSAGQ